MIDALDDAEYVERSYHEAFINAFAHRDDLINGSEVHIDIFDDRTIQMKRNLIFVLTDINLL